MFFVDFEKAFVPMDSQVLWKIFRHYGIPAKIARMIHVLYDGFQARVFHDWRMSQPFETWVRKGCLLSPYLFLVTFGLGNYCSQLYDENKTRIQFTML